MARISFFLKEAFGSLKRNYFMTIAALVTVFLSIVVLGGVLVFVYTTDALLAEVESKVEITVYLVTDPDPEPSEIEAMQSEIMSWSEVKSSTFVSKEEALERLKEDFKDNPEILEGLTGNPLARVLRDRAQRSPDGRDRGRPLRRGPHRGRGELRQGDRRQDLQLHVARRGTSSLIFIVLLGIVAILLISNTIRLSIFARKREVEIMKLVGATNWFIRWPFVIEGVTVGFFGALLAAVVVLVANSFLVGKIREACPSWPCRWTRCRT